MSHISRVLKQIDKEVKEEKERGPLWKGPEEDGITQSLLGYFLVDRERFRLKVIEGLGLPDTFNHRIEYGSMWHVCEEVYDAMEDQQVQDHGKFIPAWKSRLRGYTKLLQERYPLQQETIVHYYRLCELQFPLYVAYWKKRDKRKRTWERKEETFSVPYALPSGRVVILRGKWDGEFWKYRPKRRIMRENKTKGDINEQRMLQQLRFDMQTMFYLTARNLSPEHEGRVEELEYNIVRRPLSGGKGTIRRHKAKGKTPEETPDHFYGRVKQIIEDDPDHYFMRWDVVISEGDVEKFRRQFLNPILEQLCDWWDWVIADPDPFRTDDCSSSYDIKGIHWRHPYGVYNVLNEGGSTEYDEKLDNGSEVGLERIKTLFPELEE